MKKEIVTIDNINITVDLSKLVSTETIMFNATQIAKQFGKNVKDYIRNESTQKYINALCRKENYPFENLVNVIKGGIVQGTWLHNKLAIDFARWLSPTSKQAILRQIKDNQKELMSLTKINTKNKHIEKQMMDARFNIMMKVICLTGLALFAILAIIEFI